MKDFFMLEINLSDQTHKKTDISQLFEEYLGGTGVATKLFYDILDEKIPPLHEASPVFFAIGPLSSIFPVATKTIALFRSPLTGDLGESHAGGRLSLAMYGAGYYVMKITGKSKVPVYIIIENEKITFKQANSLKGMSATATERILRDSEVAVSTSNTQVSSFKRSILRIGPAGERLSPIACVTVDGSRHFGRLGLGAVLGSKNLKAMVISGNRYQPLEKKVEYNKIYKELYDAVVNSSAMKKYHDLGTSMNVLPLSKINSLPTRNFSQGYFEGANRISGEAFAEKFLTQQTACAHCQVGCIHFGTLREAFNTEDHMYKINKIAYDYELIFSIGSNLSIDNPEGIMKILLKIEKQGWDAMSIGGTLAWVTEAFQRGVISQKDTGNLAINFGDTQMYLKVLEKIEKGENEFYKDLEKGVSFCAEKYGGKEFGMVFGKNEAPGYMTGVFAFLGFSTGIRHSHLDAAGYSIDQANTGKEMDLEKQTEKLYGESKWRMILNSLVICLFARNIYSRERILNAFSAVNFGSWDHDKLDNAATKILLLKYKIKEKLGYDLLRQQLPEKAFRIVTANGKIKKEEYEKCLEYYSELLERDRKRMEVSPDYS